jgi:polygalacturonase
MNSLPFRLATLALLAAAPLTFAQTGKPGPWATTLQAQLHAMADHLTATVLPWEVPDRVFAVEDFGAVGDGETLNTVAIQKAVEACSAAGGGVVLFAKGDYVTGTIDLRSGVMIEVAKGARILASLDLEDYPERIPQRPTVMDTHMKMRQSLFYGEGLTRVGFRGHGEIDFRGSQENFPGRQTISETPGRPFGIRIIDSRHILVEDITLKDAACWMQNYLNCEDMIFQRMKVDNHANHNNDGLDLDGCRRVIVRDCVINSEDDAMCIKGASLRPSEDILIENSTFVTTCNAFKIGTDTQGDFRRIFVRNVRLGGIPEGMRSWKGRQASTGITIATVDGGDIEDFLISNVVIEDARAPIFIRVGSRGRLMPGMPPAKIGALRRIVIEDVTGAHNPRQGSFISGIEGGLVEDIVIRRVDLGMAGGGTPEMAAAIIHENEKGYPDAHQFAVNGLPAYGFYLRHARNVFFEDIIVEPAEPDARPLFASGGNLEGIFLDGAPLNLPPPGAR